MNAPFREAIDSFIKHGWNTPKQELMVCHMVALISEKNTRKKLSPVMHIFLGVMIILRVKTGM